MAGDFLTAFDTPIGPCALAWWGEAIRAVQLPEADADATMARLRARLPAAVESAPSVLVAAAITEILGLLNGEPRSLAEIAIDEDGLSDFDRRVYRAARRVEPGSTSTYGEIATAIGAPGEARAVGQSLGRNPFPIIVPCHRILAAGGRTGGFSGAGGVGTKLRMLTIERAKTRDEPSLFDLGGFPLQARPPREGDQRKRRLSNTPE